MDRYDFSHFMKPGRARPRSLKEIADTLDDLTLIINSASVDFHPDAHADNEINDLTAQAYSNLWRAVKLIRGADA
jgi:hypothetical protein